MKGLKMFCCFCGKEMYDITHGKSINYICYNIYCSGYYKAERIGVHFYTPSSFFEDKPKKSEGRFYTGEQWNDMMNQEE